MPWILGISPSAFILCRLYSHSLNSNCCGFGEDIPVLWWHSRLIGLICVSLYPDGQVNIWLFMTWLSGKSKVSLHMRTQVNDLIASLAATWTWSIYRYVKPGINAASQIFVNSGCVFYFQVHPMWSTRRNLGQPHVECLAPSSAYIASLITMLSHPHIYY